MRALLVVLAVSLMTSCVAWAVPTVDSAKQPDERLPWQAKGKFSGLHGDDAGWQGRWQGFGSFDQARTILSYALRSPTGYSAEARGHALLDAARQASQACGDEAAKYRRLIDTLIRAGDACNTWRDTTQALEGGMDFLVNGGGSSLCQGMLTMGLSMTRGAMSSYENAYKILWAVVSEAQREAQTENQQWYSIMSFTKTGADQTRNWRNGYLIMERIAYTVANAQQGQTVYMMAMANIAQASLDNAEDIYKVLVAGLREYERNCPSRTHQLLANYLVACADKIKTWAAAKELLCTAVVKMQNLSFDAPAAKVMLQAGLDLSAGQFGSAEDQYNVANEAGRRVRQLDVPQHIASILDMALRDANAARTYFDGANILRRAFSDLLAM